MSTRVPNFKNLIFQRISYHTAIVNLLRPLLDLKGFPVVLVKEVILKHAQQGLLLLKQEYGARYGYRFQSSLQMFQAVHLSDTIARFFPGSTGHNDEGLSAIELGLECLLASYRGFPVAGILYQMLRSNAEECLISPNALTQISLPILASQRFFKLDELIDACTKPTYLQPISNIHKLYAPSFSADWVSENDGVAFPLIAQNAERQQQGNMELDSGPQDLMQIGSLLNDS